jgi:hypothetical protein
MVVQPAERLAQGICVEVRIAGPVGLQQQLRGPLLQAERQVPRHLVLVQLVPGRTEVEVIGREPAQLGTDEGHRINWIARA